MNKKLNNVVLFTIDSAFSTIYLNALLPKIHEDVSLICISERYGEKYGSLTDQVIEHIRDNGLRYSFYMAAIYIFHIPIIFIMNMFAGITGRKSKIQLIGQLAKKYNIEVVKLNDVNDPEFVDKLRGMEPDIIVSAYFDQIMKEEVFATPKMGTINFHPGFLPDFPGPSATFWAMKNHGNVGSTVHYVDAGIDTGNIISQNVISQGAATTVIGMDYEVFSSGAEQTLDVLHAIETGSVEETKQPKGGIYYSFPKTVEVKEAMKDGVKLMRLSEYLRFFTLPVNIKRAKDAAVQQ